MCRRLIISILAQFFVCAVYTSAEIVYVDAADGKGGNTTLATGKVFKATVDVSGGDNLWCRRAFGNSGTVFESGGQYGEAVNTEDCPRLMTSIRVPENEYKVYVYFWSDTSSWRIQASLENFKGDLPVYIANDPNGGATVAAAGDFQRCVPILNEDNRILWQAYLGDTGLTAEINVYIDDEPNHLTHNARTWYDGIGYEVTPVRPVHSYTFEDGTVNDVIGEAHGTLVGDAAVIDGALVTSFQDQWMEMPGDVIAMNTYSEVSIEVWCTPMAGVSTSWSTLAYFGGRNPSSDRIGVDYFFIATMRLPDNSRTAISVGDYSTPWVDETGVDGSELDDGLLHHIVSTLTATDISLYIDGVLIGSAGLVGDNHIDGISPQLAYIAKSGYADPVWSGSIEEFNIYDKALSLSEVQAKCAAGPLPLPDRSGSVVGWGWDADGQAAPPAGNDYIALSAGEFYSLALKQDGSIVGWGSDSGGQSTPPGGNDYVAIAAGRYHFLALKQDGSIVGWGGNSYGQTTVPAGSDYIAIAAGEYHSLALKQDGSIVGWGMDNCGQATPPAGNDYVAVAAGGRHSLALRHDGSVVGWGWNSYRQAISPAGSDYMAIAAGQEHSLANRKPCQYLKDR